MDIVEGKRIKTDREVELEITLELARNLLSHAIAAIQLLDGSTELCSQLLQGKNKIIKRLEGRNGL